MSAIAKKSEPAPLRALTEYTNLPAGHVTFQVTDRYSQPHLKLGEFAVVDMRDREPQHGELFVIQWESGARRRAIVQTFCRMEKIAQRDLATGRFDLELPPVEELCWWLGDLVRPRSRAEVDAWMRAGALRLVDGPYNVEHLRKKLIGRIVGYASSELGNVLPAEAGWEDEEAGNAAFDPAEYVDALVAAGYGPAAWVIDGKIVGYCEIMPDRAVTSRQDELEERVTAVRWKYIRASTAADRVQVECFRRGLYYPRPGAASPLAGA